MIIDDALQMRFFKANVGCFGDRPNVTCDSVQHKIQ